MAKSVETLPDDELRKIAQEDKKAAQAIRGLFKESVVFAARERERLEAGFVDFAQRGGALMAVAGLLALIPFPNFGDGSIIKHFFIWVYPFLGAAIVAFFIGSFRLHIKTGSPLLSAEGARDELIILRNQSAAAFRILEKMNGMYERVLKAHRYTTISILLYLIAFIFHYGWGLWTNALPNRYLSLAVTFTLLLLGRLIFINVYSKIHVESFGVEENRIEQEIMLGGMEPPKQQTPPKKSKSK